MSRWSFLAGGPREQLEVRKGITEGTELSITRTDFGEVQGLGVFEQDECTLQEERASNRDKTQLSGR